MKVGIIARCDDRGLGNQTWEVARHLPHERVLVVRDPGSENQGFAPHPERFPEGTVAWFGRDQEGFSEHQVREWLDGLDVVYSAETYYDWRMCVWAAEMGVATVLHTNPEFYFHWSEPSVPQPSTWWSATSWRRDKMPQGTRIVPMPVPIDRWPEPDFEDNPRRVLHVGGLGAIRDRNGTQILKLARRYLSGVEVVITSQGPVSARVDQVTREQHSNPEYWTLYEGFPMMVLPRRYGGLCLPTIEAVGAGLVVAMPECSPNDCWPTVPLPCHPERKTLATQGGDVTLHETDPKQMARVINEVFDSGALPDLRRKSYEWACQNSWGPLTPVWMRELEVAVEVFRRERPRHRRYR